MKGLLLATWHPERGEIKPKSCSHVHPRKLTWNLKMNPWKRRFLWKTIIFRFHVSFMGCTPFSSNNSTKQHQMTGHVPIFIQTLSVFWICHQAKRPSITYTHLSFARKTSNHYHLGFLSTTFCYFLLAAHLLYLTHPLWQGVFICSSWSGKHLGKLPCANLSLIT